MLIDTHIWLRWLSSNDQPLPQNVVQCVSEAETLTISAISVWEAALLNSLIIATAIEHTMTLLSLDDRFPLYQELNALLITGKNPPQSESTTLDSGSAK